MPATLRAVAEAAGVHVATASRALNAETSHLVRPATRQRVLEAAERLDYRADFNAAALRSGRSRLVGILVPGLSNPVYGPITAGAAEVLDQNGIGTMVGDTGILRERSGELVRALLARRVDGLLMATSFEDRDGAVEEAVRHQLPLVLLNRGRAGLCCVRPDHATSMGLLVDHLVGLGHRNIGFMGGNLRSVWRDDRREAFDAALARHSLKPFSSWEVPGYGREAGREGALALLPGARAMTALCCGNDMTAMGVRDAARALGLELPASLSITGHNDIPFMDAVSPPLTTVRVDYHAMGMMAATMLLRRIAGEAVPDALVPVELVVRGSTAPPRG